MDVSIIVLTYHADPVKLRQTLSAAAAQEGVETEILICDDGSPEKDFSFLPEFMESLSVKNYTLIENPENRGTVQNCLSGLRKARGKYVFLTSPGDLIFDSGTMRDFFRFAEENQAKLCFGNSVCYYCREDFPELTRETGLPANPRIYTRGKKAGKTAFFGGDWVIGAAYFRETASALRYFEAIAGASKYTEDTPSTMYALAEGEELRYLDRNIVWYEDGSGISTGTNERWQRLLRQDLVESLRLLKKIFPRDPQVDLAYCNGVEENRKKRILYKIFRHPVLTLKIARGRKKSSRISCSREDLERLNMLLKKSSS